MADSTPPKTKKTRTRKDRPSLTPRASTTGLKIWGGQIQEDYLPELRGKRAIAVYDEMRKGNPIAGGFVRAIEMAFRSVIWSDIPFEDTPEGRERAAFLTSCRNDMRDPWANIIANSTTLLPFGHAPFEMTFKFRNGFSGRHPSSYTDGKVGIDNLDLIPQDTIERWEVEDPRSSKVVGLIQKDPVSQEEVTISLDKIFNPRLRTEKENPEGESIFRQAYRSWFFMNNLEAIEGISLERTGAGIPVITLPKGATTIKDKGALSDEQAAIDIVRQVRVDEQGGIVLFEGWDFRLARPEGRVDPDLFDLAIKRHRSNMLISVLAAFLEFGTARVGSFALAQQSRSFFEVALEGYVGIFEEQFNKRVVPLLFELNGITDGKLPRLTHTTVGDPELQNIARYISDLSKSGYLSPTPILNEYLKDLARFPKGATVSERQSGAAALEKDEKEQVEPQPNHSLNTTSPSDNGDRPRPLAVSENGEEDEDEGRRIIRRLARKAEEE